MKGTKCCQPTEEELEMLSKGDYTPEELWGGKQPTCHKCIDKPVEFDDVKHLN